MRIVVSRIDALEHFADELIGAPVDAQDRVAKLRRKGGVVHRVFGIEQPPHHVLHAVGRFDDADQQIPVTGIDPAEDDLRAVVERLVEIVHERLFVHAALVQRPRRFGPAERAVVAQRGRRGRRRTTRAHEIGSGGAVRLPVHRRHVELQLVAGVHQQQLRHAVQPDEEVDAELEVDPAAHASRFEQERLARRFPPSPSSPRDST